MMVVGVEVVTSALVAPLLTMVERSLERRARAREPAEAAALALALTLTQEADRGCVRHAFRAPRANSRLWLWPAHVGLAEIRLPRAQLAFIFAIVVHTRTSEF